MKETKDLLMSLDLISAISQYLYNNRKKAESSGIADVTKNNEYFDELDPVEAEDAAVVPAFDSDEVEALTDNEQMQEDNVNYLEDTKNTEDTEIYEDDVLDSSMDSILDNDNQESLLDSFERSINELSIEEIENADTVDENESSTEINTEDVMSEAHDEQKLEIPVVEIPTLDTPVLETPELNLNLDMEPQKQEDDAVVCPACNKETHETTEKRCELCGALLDVNEGTSEKDAANNTLESTDTKDDETEEEDPFSNYEDPDKKKEKAEPVVMQNTEPLHNVDSSEKAKKEYDSIMEFFNSL